MIRKPTLLLIALLCFGAGSASAVTYTSLPGAGIWSDPTTWSPAGVPGTGDDVIITGEVVLIGDRSCRDLTVQSTGWLHNNTSHRSLAVEGNLVNDGTISDTAWTLQMFIQGDATNGGAWNVNRVAFTGPGLAHTLEHTAGGTLTGDNLELHTDTGPLTLVGPMTTAAVIDLNGGQMNCTPGADVTMTAGRIQEGTVDVAGNVFDIADGVYLWNVTMADPVFRGVARVYSGCTLTGTIVNEGEFRNRASTHVSVIVDGDFQNHGTVTDTSWTLDMLVSGDVLNDGVWSNYRVTFTGAGTPHVLESSGGTTFVPDNIVLEAGTGTLSLPTPTTFASEVDLNGGRIECAPGADLTLLSGRMQEGTLDAAGNAVDMTDGVYFWNLQVDDPVLQGVARVYSGCTLAGTVVVEGELHNRAGTHVTCIVDGDLENHGTITSTNWTLNLHVSGDILNDGVWTNNIVLLTGAGVPHAYSQTAGKSIEPNRLELETGTGPLAVNSVMVVGGIIDLNGGQMNCAPGADIELLSGYLSGGGLDAAGNDLTLAEGVYLWSMQVDDPVLRGSARVYSNVTMTGTVTVQDTLRNRVSTHVTLDVNGDLINNGVISDTNWTLNLNISGNATNNGVWENNTTTFDGTEDQFILVDDLHPLGDSAIFNSNLAGAPYTWSNSGIAIPGGTSPNWTAGLLDESMYGQYRCSNGAGDQSRWIHVSPHFDTTAAPEAPAVFALERNHPNPFNPMTRIAFSLPAASQVQLTVHDLKGRRVRTLIDGVRGAGRHTVEWRGENDADRQVAAGVYLSVLRTTEGTLTRKLMLLP